MSAKTYNAGVKEYRQTYWMPEYTPLDTDILAVFKITRAWIARRLPLLWPPSPPPVPGRRCGPIF